MVIGSDLKHGLEAAGLTFVSNIFTERSHMWYTSLRAIGFSMPTGQAGTSGVGMTVWNLDFNQFSLAGAPTRLDSGSKNIRVGHLVFERLITNMGDGRCMVNDEEGIDCPCNQAEIESQFPWISLSFETFDNPRILGFDYGYDTRVCIPPSAYVSPAAKSGMCRLAIVDAGMYQKFFGLEGIVLGMPFFQSVQVGIDLERRALAFGAPLYATPRSVPGMSGATLTGEAVQVEGGQSPVGLGANKAECPCADPKNWWNTGHRYSAARVTLVLIGTTATLLYVFLVHSQSAQGLRSQMETIMGSSPPNTSPGPGVSSQRNNDRGSRPNQGVELSGGTQYNRIDDLSPGR